MIENTAPAAELRPTPISATDLQAWRTRQVWADRVRLERILRGWSQRDLARVAGVTHPQIARVEKGARHCRREVFVGIARAFVIPAAELFPYDDALDGTAAAAAVAS